MSVLPICGDKLGSIVPGFFLPYSSETFPPSFAKRHKDAEPLCPIVQNVHVRFACLIILGINITVEQLAVADGIPGSKKLCRMLSPRLQKKTRKFIFSYQVAVVIQGDVFSNADQLPLFYFITFRRGCPLLCVHILPPPVAGVVLDRAAAILVPPTLPVARPGMYRSRPVCRTSGSRWPRRGGSPAAAALRFGRRQPFAQGAPGALCATASSISPVCRDSPSFARDFA